MFLGLRLLDGVDAEAYRQRYGVDPRRRFRPELKRLEKQGLIVCEKNHIRLTPRGVALGNLVFGEFV